MERAKLKLKRSLSLFESTLYGIGIILGAGIYALVGIGSGIAGNMLWLSFLISAVLALLTGLSYAELSSMCPKEAAEYHYAKRAFKRRGISFIIGWLVVVSVVIAGATVALGFSNYFSHLFGTPIVPVAIILIAVFSIVNFIGIEESAKVNVLETLVEFSGLVIIIAIGASFIFTSNTNFFATPNDAGLSGVISSVIITFFAFWGFEGIVNLSEETKNPKKTVPRALMLSIIISTILYVLVALTAISVVGWEKLAASKAPLADVARTAIPDLDLSLLLSVIALFATSNTVLVSLILSSRALYGIASDNSLPPVFSRIHVKRKTPYIAVFTVMILMMIAASFQDLKMVATLADAAIFTTYFAVNICLIWLRFSEPKADRPFKAPLSIGRMPLLALVGAASILILMALYVEPIFLLAEAGIVIVGYLIHRASRKKI